MEAQKIDFSAIFDTLVAWALSTGVKLIISAIILVVSFKLINWIGKKIVLYREGKDDKKKIVLP